MTVMNAKEVEDKFDITEQELDALEKDATQGILHGKPRGKVIVGRPLMFNEEMKQVGFKEPLQIVNAIDKRAKQLGKTRSEYLRYLVDSDLKLAGLA